MEEEICIQGHLIQDFQGRLWENESVITLIWKKAQEKIMSTELKYSLVTTIIALGVIVCGALTAVLH